MLGCGCGWLEVWFQDGVVLVAARLEWKEKKGGLIPSRYATY